MRKSLENMVLLSTKVQRVQTGCLTGLINWADQLGDRENELTDDSRHRKIRAVHVRTNGVKSRSGLRRTLMQACGERSRMRREIVGDRLAARPVSIAQRIRG